MVRPHLQVHRYFLTNWSSSVFPCDSRVRFKEPLMSFCSQSHLRHLSGISSCHLLIMTCFTSLSTWLQVIITVSILPLIGMWSFDVISQVRVFTRWHVCLVPRDGFSCLSGVPIRFVDVCEPWCGSLGQRALLP